MIIKLIFTFLIGFLATTIGVISGVGGGVIIKPVMDAISGLPSAHISFMSGCTVLAMSIISLLRSRGGSVKVEVRRGTLLAVGATLGGLIGKSWFDWIKLLSGNDGLIGVIQSSMMIILTSGVLLYVTYQNKIKTKNITNTIGCVVVGLVLGILSSFLGIGGGPINIAVLYFFFSMESKTAALHSIYIIFFSQVTSLISTLVKGNVPKINIYLLLFMVVGGIAGGLIGSNISKRISNKSVDCLFRWLIVFIILISFYNLYKNLGHV